MLAMWASVMKLNTSACWQAIHRPREFLWLCAASMSLTSVCNSGPVQNTSRMIPEAITALVGVISVDVDEAGNSSQGQTERHRRYDRQRGRDWPPTGFTVLWNEASPRQWGDYTIPDDVTSEDLWDHIKAEFNLSGAPVCRWVGCTRRTPDRLLRRHVESVHLGMRLKCTECTVSCRADHRYNAHHDSGCLNASV